jgi:hypothetical protein
MPGQIPWSAHYLHVKMVELTGIEPVGSPSKWSPGEPASPGRGKWSDTRTMGDQITSPSFFRAPSLKRTVIGTRLRVNEYD